MELNFLFQKIISVQEKCIVEKKFDRWMGDDFGTDCGKLRQTSFSINFGLALEKLYFRRKNYFCLSEKKKVQPWINNFSIWIW